MERTGGTNLLALRDRSHSGSQSEGAEWGEGCVAGVSEPGGAEAEAALWPLKRQQSAVPTHEQPATEQSRCLPSTTGGPHQGLCCPRLLRLLLLSLPHFTEDLGERAVPWPHTWWSPATSSPQGFPLLPLTYFPHQKVVGMEQRRSWGPLAQPQRIHPHLPPIVILLLGYSAEETRSQD